MRGPSLPSPREEFVLKVEKNSTVKDWEEIQVLERSYPQDLGQNKKSLPKEGGYHQSV